MKKFLTVLAILALSLPVFAQRAQETILKDISYVSPDDTSAYRKERCKLDIYLPKDQKGFTTIVWFHGGGLTGGEKSCPEVLRRKGLAIECPNYRLSPKATNPAYTQDAAAAVAWTVKHIEEMGGDPSKIYVSGHSAGGYLAMMMALATKWLNAEGIDPDSIKGYLPVSGQTVTHYTIRSERGLPDGIPIIDEYAPVNNARILGTKLLLITGDRKMEMSARYEENLFLQTILRDYGNKGVELYELNGFNHGTVVAPACHLILDIIKKDK